jgi:hypothetical protein
MKLFDFIHSLFILIFYLGALAVFPQGNPESCIEIYELKNESFKNKVFLESGKFLFDIVSNPKPNCNLKLVFKNGISHISRKSYDSRVYLHFSKDRSETILQGNNDLLYLLSSSGLMNGKTSFLDLAKVNSLEDLLSVALEGLGNKFKKIKAPSGEDWFGGNPNAQNLYNSGNFNYTVIEQLHSDDEVKEIVSKWKKHPEWKLEPDGGKSHIDAKYLSYFNFSEGKIPGLECAAATAMHLYKSLGLVRPDMTRLELEETYTKLHRKVSQRNGVIPARYNNALRGMDGFPINSQTYADWANILKESDWAKLTGAYRIQKYKFKLIKSNVLLKKVNDKYTTVLATLNKKGGFSGHIYLITDVGKEELRVDESFEWQPAKKVKLINDGYSSLLVLEGK